MKKRPQVEHLTSVPMELGALSSVSTFGHKRVLMCTELKSITPLQLTAELLDTQQHTTELAVVVLLIQQFLLHW